MKMIWIGLVMIIFGATGILLFSGSNEQEFSWDDVGPLLKSGNVEMVSRLHSGEVSLHMDNGTIYSIMEPEGEDIFVEIHECGDPCTDIAIAIE